MSKGTSCFPSQYLPEKVQSIGIEGKPLSRLFVHSPPFFCAFFFLLIMKTAMPIASITPIATIDPKRISSGYTSLSNLEKIFELPFKKVVFIYFFSSRILNGGITIGE